MQVNKKNKYAILLMILVVFCGMLLISGVSIANAKYLFQIPTGSVPTVTGTPVGAVAVVKSK